MKKKRRSMSPRPVMLNAGFIMKQVLLIDLKYFIYTITTFFAVCQTTYQQKNVTEDEPRCEDQTEQMCDQNGENCMNFRRKVSFAFIFF